MIGSVQIDSAEIMPRKEDLLHTPAFRIDEHALAMGSASLAATAIEWMQKKG